MLLRPKIFAKRLLSPENKDIIFWSCSAVRSEQLTHNQPVGGSNPPGTTVHLTTGSNCPLTIGDYYISQQSSWAIMWKSCVLDPEEFFDIKLQRAPALEAYEVRILEGPH